MVFSANLKTPIQTLAQFKQPERLAKLAPLVTVALIVLFSGSLAQLTWTVLAPGAHDVVPLGSAVERIGQSEQRPRYLEQVAERHLFGRHQPEAAVVIAPPPVEIPQTRLRLELKGVMALADPRAGTAIIAGNGGDEQHYAIGASLPGGARLEQVYPDHVILFNQGKEEKLLLVRELPDKNSSTVHFSGNSSVAPAPPPMPTLPEEMPPDAQAGNTLAARRAEWLNDPSSFFDAVRIQPMMEQGQLRGFAISPRRDARLFRELGLRPGDVVTAVNGQPVASITNPAQLQTQLAQASQLTLDIERNGQPHSLNIALHP